MAFSVADFPQASLPPMPSAGTIARAAVLAAPVIQLTEDQQPEAVYTDKFTPIVPIFIVPFYP